ncbi:MAG: hypothetical protein ACO1QS_19705 [Verrucomicrobiota bacterium]
MKPDDFESQLQRQPLRGLPKEWRMEILSAAHEAVAQMEPEPGFWATLWLEIFVKPRMAWGGMGAAWLVALILNVSSGGTTEPASQMAQQQQPVEAAPEVMQMVREQQRLRDELLGIGVAAVELSPADKPRDGLKPRSERREDYAVV